MGSLNIDYVYRVPHFVQPGETISSYGREIFAGGKGLVQVAIMLCGKPKVLYAALAAGVGRIFGKRGVFYEITGPQVAGLDGFYSTYFEDYKNFGILSPKEPDKAAAKVEEETGIHCCIADINDFGGEVLAVSPKSTMDKPLLQKLLKDNPAGNGHEMTPFVLMREKKD